MRNFGIIILGLAFIFNTDLEAKENLITVNDKDSYYNPALNASYLIDKNNRLKIHDIFGPEYHDIFIPNNQEIINIGFVPSTLWLKFTIQNVLSTSLYLEIDNPALDTIEYFLFNTDHKLVHHHLTGNHLNIENRSLNSGNLMIDLNLNDSSIHTCYIKINSTSSTLLAPLRIASLKKFYEINQRESVWQGIYFGLILFLFIYNLFLFISLKDVTYIYFALFIASMGFLFALFKGFGMQYLWNRYPEVNQFTPLIGATACIFMILFSAKFLNSKTKTPILHKWLYALNGIYVLIIISNLFHFAFLSTNLIIYNSMLGLLFLMFLAVKAWKDGYAPAKYFLLAWSFYVAGIFLSFLRDNNFIEVNVIIGNILQITSMMSILFMSFALSKKINIYIAKRNEAQELALIGAIENERLISNQNQLLEAKVNQRTIDLEQTITTLSKQRRDLKDANNFKDKVFSIISHDLKSPISTLAGMLNLMKLKSLSELERTNVIDKLEVALKSTKTLLDNILAWANKNEKSSRETEEVELHSCVEEILELSYHSANAKGISLKNLIEPNFHIIVNRDILQLILRNLISNAIKFTVKGGSVIVNMQVAFQDMSIEVKDTGIGMSHEMKMNLFKTNINTTTLGTENEKGTGLGLILCKEFVDKLNGELSVESEKGKGSSFNITLKDTVPILESVMI